MKIKVSDYISEYLVSCGITYNFTVPGGGAMYLNSSFGRQKGMHNIFVQHEQAAAMAAEAFYKMHNQLPLVCCTTGPGGTNTLTGVLGAWLDSVPMLVISGQVKYLTTVRSTGYPMRIFGDQEFDIVKTVSSMTKYAEMVTIPNMIKYHLDKALYLALHGRPGPVWLDIPQNVQNAEIDTAELLPFDPAEMASAEAPVISDKTLALLIQKIKDAQRPVIYAGAEIRIHGAYEQFIELIRKLNVPVVTSFDSIDLISDDDDLYAGRAGDVGNRYGNWAVQNSDFLLVLGNRLGVRQVSYALDTWARAAFVVMVHEDPLEITKPGLHIELPIRADVKDFMTKLASALPAPLTAKKEWLEICKGWKEKYPVVDKERHYANGEFINPYCFVNELSMRTPEDTIVVSANGSASVVGSSAFTIKKGQRFMVNCGAASMGYELPASIGACLAANKKDILCLSGDGSIQMNLQELQTIVYHKLPVKIVVINNAGYHSMRQTQDNLFKGLKHVGIGPETNDLSFPDMKKIAAAYGIAYFAIKTNEDIPVLDEFLRAEGCAMCEAFVDTRQIFEPKPTAKKLVDGTIVSPPLEDLAPFLPREELEQIMIIPLVQEDD